MSFTLRAGKYRVVGRLGEGGMGVVYRAMMTSLEGVEKPVALKVLRRDLAGAAALVDLFVEEAKTVMPLTHGNVVQAIDVGRIDERLFIALELVEGTDLAALLERRRASHGGRLPLPVALFVAVEALKGLDYAHRRTDAKGQRLGLVHCDVSPSNVLLSLEGEVKVADFGIARTAQRVDGLGDVRGKVPYMAPEQLRAGSVDLRADVYAVGALLYEMLAGRRLVDTRGKDPASVVLGGEWTSLSELVPELDDEVVTIVERALSLEPSDRWPSAAAMRDALESFAVEHAVRLSSTELADLLDATLGADEPPAGVTTMTHGSGAPSGAPGGDEMLGRELSPVLGAHGYSVYTATRVHAALPPTAAVAGMPEVIVVDSARPALPATRIGPAVRPPARPASEPSARAADGLASTGPIQLPATRTWPAAAAVLVLGAVALVALLVVRPWSSGAPTPLAAATPGAADTSPGAHTTPTTGGTTGAATDPPAGARADAPVVTGTPTGSPPGAAGPRVPVEHPTPDQPSTHATPDDPGAHRPTAAAITAGLDPSPITRSPHTLRPAPIPRDRAPVDRRARPAGTAQASPGSEPGAAGARTASISVNALPWAQVFVDGRPVHTTPVLGYDLPPGRHSIRLRGPEAEREVSVDLAPGEHRRISLDLRSAP